MFTTQLVTADNKTIIIPNSRFSGDVITNYTSKGTLRIDMFFGAGYDDDLKKVKEILLGILRADTRVLKDPAPVVLLLEMADSSVNFAARPWVKAEDYWDVLFSTMETVKRRFDEENISIPFPQQDIHIYKKQGGS